MPICDRCIDLAVVTDRPQPRDHAIGAAIAGVFVIIAAWLGWVLATRWQVKMPLMLGGMVGSLLAAPTAYLLLLHRSVAKQRKARGLPASAVRLAGLLLEGYEGWRFAFASRAFAEEFARANGGRILG